MRRLIFVAAAVVLLWPVGALCQQGQQQSQPSQTQQSSAAQGQNQGTPQAPASQDSLAEAARKAREQKKEAPKAAKVFTNDNIPTEGGISSVGTQAEAAPAKAEASAAPSGEAAANGEKPAPSNDEKTWRDRFAKLHHKLDQDQTELDIMQRELGVLDTQYYSDPMKTMQQGVSREDINKKTADIEAKKKQVEDDKKAIADAEDELRKSGGDPGWASQ